jgi:twinkle protein
MADSKLMSMGPCPECGSSDANGLYADGSTYCHKCHAKTTTGASDESGLDLSVEPFAIASRGLTLATCRRWGYGRTEHHGRPAQAAALHSPTGSIVGYKLRFSDKSFLKLGAHKKAEPLWGMHLWRDAGKRVVVTEGEIDAMSISQLQDHRWPVVSLPDGAGSAVKSCKAAMEWLSQFETIVLAFDMDEVGRKAAAECAVLFRPGQAKVACLPGGFKDPNDMLKAGQGRQLIDCLWNAREHRPDGLVMGDDLDEYLDRPMPKGEPWPWECLNRKTQGVRPGEIVTICAGSNVGKSTVTAQVASWFMKAGHRTGYFALEESVQVSALRTMSTLCGANLRLIEDPKDVEGYAASREVVKRNGVFFNHFGSIGDDTLLNRIRYAVRAVDCRFVVLDHLSIVVSGSDTTDERRLIDRTMTQLRSFVEETEVSMLLVSHLRRRRGLGYESGVRPRMSDLRGSAGIEQLSDVIVGLARDLMSADEDTRRLMEVSVLKNRWTGDTGPAGVLRYDPDAGRLTETEDSYAEPEEDLY